ISRLQSRPLPRKERALATGIFKSGSNLGDDGWSVGSSWDSSQARMATYRGSILGGSLPARFPAPGRCLNRECKTAVTGLLLELTHSYASIFLTALAYLRALLLIHGLVPGIEMVSLEGQLRS